MRHNQNHRGPASGCVTCKFDEEYSKARKMERKVMRFAKTVTVSKIRPEEFTGNSISTPTKETRGQKTSRAFSGRNAS